jgi:excisionase family DNA binding protein
VSRTLKANVRVLEEGLQARGRKRFKGGSTQGTGESLAELADCTMTLRSCLSSFLRHGATPNQTHGFYSPSVRNARSSCGRDKQAACDVQPPETGRGRNRAGTDGHRTAAWGSTMSLSSNPVLLTIDEVGTLLRTSRKAIYTMVERGQLPGVVRIGRRVLVREDALLDWLGQGPRHRQEGRR